MIYHKNIVTKILFFGPYQKCDIKHHKTRNIIDIAQRRKALNDET
jgi:hypothetical protein